MELAVPIRGLAGISGWEPHFVGSLHELEVAVAEQGRRALTVGNLQPPLAAWQVGQRLRVLGKIEEVAAGDANVCIAGESGAGKELIARAIHAQSARWDRPLVTLDCTAIPEGLMESDLV